MLTATLLSSFLGIALILLLPVLHWMRSGKLTAPDDLDVGAETVAC